MPEPKHTNALIHETSPYLLQHAHNPVQWHPWTQEALHKAHEEDKPILLSIGYSACHWCHVMERESFENEGIAALQLDFLMRSHARNGDEAVLAAVEQTLRKMACGGIYDQLGGGFHRYSVDACWLVPHFEKMLYDNALLSRAYLHAFLLTRRPLYRRVAAETLDYVLREMTSSEGGFYSAQDADSEGIEGKFYTWEWSEVQSLIGGEHAALFCRYYGVTPDGNHEGRNILHIARSIDQLGSTENLPEEDPRQRLARGKAVLLAAREKRRRPARDEKILTAWNGLMLKSFAEAAQGLEREDYRNTAVRCAGFLLAAMDRNGRLQHTYKDGEARVDAFLDDYACLVDGLLSLYESTFDPRWLKEAAQLAEIMTAQFQDPAGAGFFLDGGHETLIHRPKEFYDRATPSGNSVAAHALLRLAKFTGDEGWAHHALALLKAMAAPMARHPAAFGNLMGALDFELSGAWEIALVGESQEEATRVLLHEVNMRYLPNKVVACGMNPDLFMLRDRVQISGRPTAYVCRNHVCGEPVTSAAALAALLDERGKLGSGLEN